MSDETPARILLVGFMASGKSSVGTELASRLGWDFEDFDSVIEADTGKTISQIFDEDGEAEFRRVESGVAERLLARSETVLASGGGWPAQPGSWDLVTAGTMSVWLQVSSATAVGRATEQGPKRPLLSGGDVAADASALLLAREAAYGRAQYSLDTEQRDPQDLAEEIIKLMKQRGPMTRQGKT